MLMDPNTQRLPRRDTPPPPPDRDKDNDKDDNDAPATPPTEPEPVPVEEPPNAPGKRGPYVVAPARRDL
jgi:hypothetical protein